MATQDEEFQKSLLAAFAIEAAEHTQALSEVLLRLEDAGGAGESALVEEIYREAHSLKGAARAVNLISVENVCQALETIFSAWKKGQVTATPALFDALHQGVDTVTDLLSATETDEVPQIANVVERLNTLGRGATSSVTFNYQSPTATNSAQELPSYGLFAFGDPPTPLSSSPTNGEEAPPKNGAAIHGEGANGSAKSSFAYKPLSALSFLVQEETLVVDSSTPESETVARPEAPMPTAPTEHFSGGNGSGHGLASSTPALTTAPPLGLPSSPQPAPPAYTAQAVPRASIAASEETVRVATSRLDGMLLQAEEMLLVKQATIERATELRRVTAQFAIWQKEWGKILPDFRAAGGENSSATMTAATRRMLDFLEWNYDYIEALEAQVEVLARAAEIDRRATTGLVDNLLEDAKKLLMLPFSHLIGIFPKMVRDLARHQEKDVALDLAGAEVQIDKRILEELKDPLIHLLRNSVDHGIETSDERLRTGKPAVATVTLRVTQKSGSEVEVWVSDDGRGINAEAVKASALKNGLLAPEKAEQMSRAEVIDLIFQSSLSTSPIITEISGRGLGMAIVREKVEKLGGHIVVESTFGVGTTFRILLPLTLATFRGVLVEVKGQTFVLPATEVERAVRVPLAGVRRVHNRDTITLPRAAPREGARDRDVLPFIPLADVLELGQGAAPAPRDHELRLAVVLAGGDQRIAFEVDAVINEQEVLVKPFSKPLLRVRNVAGATILASGKAVPILNVSDLLLSSLRHTTTQGISPLGDAGSNASTLEADVAPQKSVLVAEDSITSRMLLKNILESAGYRVTTAVDGLDALTTLRSGQFDLVVSDVDMPRLNGLDFTAKVREEERFSQLPVILVTARSTREDRERGIDVGANAYIVKSTFDQNDLLEVVQRLI